MLPSQAFQNPPASSLTVCRYEKPSPEQLVPQTISSSAPADFSDIKKFKLFFSTAKRKT